MKLALHSVGSLIIIVLLIIAADLALLYFIDMLAFNTPAFVRKIPLGDIFFVGFVLYIYSMLLLFISRSILKHFKIPRVIFWITVLLGISNVVYMLNALWVESPRLSFWNGIIFIMIAATICTISFLFSVISVSND